MIIHGNKQHRSARSAPCCAETAKESSRQTAATAAVCAPAEGPAAALESLRRRAGRLQKLLSGDVGGAQREALIVEAALLLLKSAVSFSSRFLER
ncbi:MAG: hypothetical protein HDQ87_06555 [Clostridia bacterium]|nr:hypothetical protein [Clostridia bacterium]